MCWLLQWWCKVYRILFNKPWKFGFPFLYGKFFSYFFKAKIRFWISLSLVWKFLFWSWKFTFNCLILNFPALNFEFKAWYRLSEPLQAIQHYLTWAFKNVCVYGFRLRINVSPLPLKNVPTLVLYFHETLQKFDWLKLNCQQNLLSKSNWR